jgi:hypothetical protein
MTVHPLYMAIYPPTVSTLIDTNGFKQSLSVHFLPMVDTYGLSETLTAKQSGHCGHLNTLNMGARAYDLRWRCHVLSPHFLNQFKHLSVTK